MTKTPKLAIFDLDGTIATKGVVAPSVIEGMKHLHAQGCITTLSTGRGYSQLKDALGTNFNDIVSPEAIIILEHGTKLVNRQGDIVFGEFLSDVEIDHIIDFARANIGLLKFAWFNHDNGKVSVWCVDESDVDEQAKRRKHYAEVFAAPIGELRERLLGERLTSVSFRLKEHIKVENLKLVFTRTEINVIFQDSNMEFMRSNINKGLSVLWVMKKLGITKANSLLAGNAINDVEMLDLGVGTSILVGPKEYRKDILSYLSEPESILGVNSPDDLGKYLQSL